MKIVFELSYCNLKKFNASYYSVEFKKWLHLALFCFLLLVDSDKFFAYGYQISAE